MYEEFEASVKSQITPDVEFIKQNDEILKSLLKEGRKKSPVFFLLLLFAAVVFFFINKIIMIICALAGAIALFLYIRTRKFARELMDENYIKEIYEEGLLTAGMITKTNPLTVMAIADMRAQDDCEPQYACCVVPAGQLPGAKGELYEKIPCSSMFRYESGSYHSSFQPHPLYWGTRNQDEIRAAMQQLEEAQKENDENEWEILKKISADFPDLKPDQLLLLDASYQPIGIKQSWEDDYVPVVTEAVLSRYPKSYPDITRITDDIPAASIYNKMIELAERHQVYEYISTHCRERDYAPLSNPGYFTYISDPLTFLEALGDRNITLAEGEYPLLAGIMLMTTKGCWRKKEFIPWQDITLEAEISSLGDIETSVNGKCIAAFKPNTEYYLNKGSFTKDDMAVIRQIELKRIRGFLQELKELCQK